jgi:L-iditol 2-dehydrogenase
MKAAVLHGKMDLRVEEVNKPAIGANDVLVAPKAVGICGSDLHLYRGTWKIETPRIIGHEVTGRIEEVGQNVSGWKEGARVAVEAVVACGKCYWCKESTVNNYFCEKYYENVMGFFGLDGAFAEYVKVPSICLYRVPDSLSYEEGALTEPLACALRGVDNVGIESGQSVTVIGAGTLGLLFVQLARIGGASKIFVLDIDEFKLKKAKDLGADVSVNPSQEDPLAVIKANTNDRGSDVVIEAVGSTQTYEQSLQLARRGGRVSLFGICPEGTMKIDAFEAYRKELRISWVFGSPRGTFRRSIELLANGRVRAAPMITHKFPLEKILDALNIMDKKQGNAIKILVQPQQG